MVSFRGVVFFVSLAGKLSSWVILSSSAFSSAVGIMVFAMHHSSFCSAAPRLVRVRSLNVVTLGGFDSSEWRLILLLLSSAETFVAWLWRDGWCRPTGTGGSPHDFAASGDARVARCPKPGRSAAGMQLTSSSQATTGVFVTHGRGGVCRGFDSDSAYRKSPHDMFWLGHVMTCDVLTLVAHSGPRSSRSRDAVPEPGGRSRTDWIFSANTR
jgi:hypothetical protein